MVDLHSHIIPEFDDGCRSLEESLQLATNQSNAGTRTLFATPHVESEVDIQSSGRILERVSELNCAIQKHGIPLEVVPGAELYPCSSVLRGLDSGAPITLGVNGKYVLIDLPHTNMVPFDFEWVLFEIVTRGITPILAHPERSPYFQGQLEKVETFLDHGVVFQVNAGSFVGRHGSGAQEFAEILFADHGKSRTLGHVASMLSTPGNEEYVRFLTVDSGQAVLNGWPLPGRPEPVQEEEKQPWYSWLTRKSARNVL